MEFERIAEAIELPDNGGRRNVAFRPRGVSAGCFVADVTITMDSVDGECGSATTLTAFRISRDKMVQLDELLADWLVDRRPFAIDIAQER